MLVEEDDNAILNLNENYKEVVELVSDSLNRHVEVDSDDHNISERVLGELKEIDLRRKDVNTKITKNEQLGHVLVEELETGLSPLEMRKYWTFLGELDKVVLLQVILRTRLRLLGENLTDQEKKKKNMLDIQLKESTELKQTSENKMRDIGKKIEDKFGCQFSEKFLDFVQTKIELILEQKMCDDVEKELFQGLESL